ncbi:MAG: glycosyltransferase family 2 protein [Anaerolineae bacterium]|nr:glycosyltransferase family 2 protein [Anaerolineae bacterium]
MYEQLKIGVVVPAYNEEVLIRRTLEGMPDYVDSIVVVDDCSPDNTSAVVREVATQDERVILIRHEQNKGVGGAISTGYIWCRENDIDAAVVMAGDNQMDPADLPALLVPVVEDRADYSKGNRLFTGEAWEKIPKIRYLGNAVLSFLTKIASGYWNVADSQTGYTVLNKKGLHLLPLENIYPRFGMPNDFLVTCNIYDLRVIDVPIRPVYADEKSKLKIRRVVFSISALLVRLFFKRMLQKYVIRDFHPLVLFYFIGALLFLLDVPLLVRFILLWYSLGYVPEITLLTIIFLTISGLQLVLFAMLFDMQANQDLKGH